MNTLTDKLLEPIGAILTAQTELDRRFIEDILQNASQTYEIVVQGKVVSVPRLLLTGIRSTVVTSARITIDFEKTSTRIIQNTSSLAMNINTEAMSDLRDQLLDPSNGRPQNVS
jgi:hypothetical protein